MSPPILSPDPLAINIGIRQLFEYDEKALTSDFHNKAKIHLDHKTKVTNSIETVLEKNLRTSTTAPVDAAMHHAGTAILDFETKDDIGGALKDGLGKFVGNEKNPLSVNLELNKREIQQLQRKIAEKRDLQLHQLYAEYLRCPADKPLHVYAPRSEQTPKHGRIDCELRKSFSDKIAQAYKDAQIEVFGGYLKEGQLEEMMGRFNDIQEQFNVNETFASKQLKYAEGLEQSTAGGDRLPGLDLGRESQLNLANKIHGKWAEIARGYQTKKAEAKATKGVKSEDEFFQAEAMADDSAKDSEEPEEELAHDESKVKGPVKGSEKPQAGPSGVGREGHPTNAKSRTKEKKSHRPGSSISSSS